MHTTINLDKIYECKTNLPIYYTKFLIYVKLVNICYNEFFFQYKNDLARPHGWGWGWGLMDKNIHYYDLNLIKNHCYIILVDRSADKGEYFLIKDVNENKYDATNLKMLIELRKQNVC